MKKLVDSVDATPAKRLYLSIIADYDTNRAICELVDNAIDIWMKSGRSRRIAIEVEIDWQQQTIKVCDDAGGIDRSELSHIVGPGHTGTAETQESIGIFGVGTKRAVVALAQAISIRTRRGKETYALEFDDNWIETEESWHINVYQVDNIPEGRTQIELVKLRKPVSAETVSRLREHLGATYAKFLLSETLDIILNGRPVDPIVFDDWAYPPHFDPRRYVGIIPGSGGTQVRVEAVAGLVKESSPAGGEYGVYFYCNDRLIARALKTFEVGFGPGLAGKPHAEISLARVLVCLNGEARLMPWNSSKSDINSSHETFVALRPWLLQVVRDYTSLARRMSKLEGGWQENVFRYTKGDIQQVEVDDFPHVNTSYLPPLPQVRPRYSTIVLGKNQEVLKKEALGERTPRIYHHCGLAAETAV